MLCVKAFHLVAMVAWFAGLFYLPRLFVYHSLATDAPGIERFKVMERRLHYGITWPAAVLTTILGIWLLSYNTSYYLKAGWMHAKLSLVVCLWGYHLMNGYYLKQFARNENRHGGLFFRIYNEIPIIFLIGIVMLVVVKPF